MFRVNYNKGYFRGIYSSNIAIFKPQQKIEAQHFSLTKTQEILLK